MKSSVTKVSLLVLVLGPEAVVVVFIIQSCGHKAIWYRQYGTVFPN